MLIFFPSVGSYMKTPRELTTKKSSALNLTFAGLTDKSYHIQDKTGKYLIPINIVKNEFSLDLNGASNRLIFYLEKNRYLYTEFGGEKFYLMTENGKIKMKPMNEDSNYSYMLEFRNKDGDCEISRFRKNSYKGIITELTYIINSQDLSTLLRLGFIPNQEDKAKNEIPDSNIVDLQEPCADCTKIKCKQALGVFLVPHLYGESTLSQYEEYVKYTSKLCVLHLSPDLLYNTYYHLNTEGNDGFKIVNGIKNNGQKTIDPKGSYTDGSIEKLTRDKCFKLIREDGEEYPAFVNYELIVRNSVSLEYLNYITFFDYADYNSFLENDKFKIPCAYRRK